MQIAIAFTCKSEKNFLEKFKLLTRDVIYTGLSGDKSCGNGSSSQDTKIECSRECYFYFSRLVPFSICESSGFLHYQLASP